MNVITVRINGIEYNLKGHESEEYLNKVANYVDKKMKNILDNNAKLSSSSAAVLSAVNAVDDLFKLKEDYNELLYRVKHFEEIETKLRDELESLKHQTKEIQSTNEDLRNKMLTLEDPNIVKKQQEEISNLQVQLDAMQESAQECIVQNKELLAQNKEIKFQLQTYKYKLIDLQNKFLDNQIDLVKIKKQKNPLLKDNVE
ncbi:cell division protein ZapA [Desnuesiella massiliensis]|uniref:cell division protein ZapA n=1 Tax=Desnuesiella massiliensis TaxID=1650662 RepID=UPI0006E3AA34|nr:cell division protein ZapA [Desnuesiella massiliensis]